MHWHVNAYSTAEQEWNGEDSGNTRASYGTELLQGWGKQGEEKVGGKDKQIFTFLPQVYILHKFFNPSCLHSQGSNGAALSVSESS